MESLKATHVVFVDDEPKICDVVRKTLGRTGLDVVCFHGVDDCLAHVTTQRCDLLITDVKMPGRDGLDLLETVRQRLPWVPVLVVTGYGDVPLAVRALKAGAADFVEKPLDRDTFLEAVQRLIERNARPVAALTARLTKTERRILYMILEAHNNHDIAEALHRSPRTIEVHRRHIQEKLGVTNIVELLRRVAEMGLLESVLPRQGEAVPRGPLSGRSGPEVKSCDTPPTGSICSA
ncbi:MAG: response regulator [Planctomycetes bacterium]|jgi:FixJ family two-component response regulator|nr:response regulator [Planctomycetota bacterium]